MKTDNLIVIIIHFYNGKMDKYFREIKQRFLIKSPRANYSTL